MHPLRKSEQPRCPTNAKTFPPFRPPSGTAPRGGGDETAVGRQSERQKSVE